MSTPLPNLPPIPVSVAPESVEAATHDLINNSGCASQIEWLQRQFMKLCERELMVLARESELQKMSGNNSNSGHR